MSSLTLVSRASCCADVSPSVLKCTFEFWKIHCLCVSESRLSMKSLPHWWIDLRLACLRNGAIVCSHSVLILPSTKLSQPSLSCTSASSTYIECLLLIQDESIFVPCADMYSSSMSSNSGSGCTTAKQLRVVDADLKKRARRPL